MTRRMFVLSAYLVAGVLISAYGASIFLAGTAQTVARAMHSRGAVLTAEAGR